MKIVADTNILVRAIVEDDAKQSRQARRELAEAEVVAIPTATLCELVWVLVRGYRRPRAGVENAISLILASDNVAIDGAAVTAGLATMRAGGDFADGVIAFEGLALGGEEFVSFDKVAVRLLRQQGRKARLAR